MQRIGVIGIGFMGKGIARNILMKNKGILNIYDADARKYDEFFQDVPLSLHQQVQFFESPKHLAQQSDVIALSLPNSDAVENVLFGGNGICEVESNNEKLVIEHGTFSQQFVQVCNKRLSSSGYRYMDIPVSGGPQGAFDGTLTLMSGGSLEDLSLSRPMLKLYSSNMYHFGDVGSGMAAKLVNQALVGIHAQAASESIYLAKKFGIQDISLLGEMLRQSWGHSKILELCIKDTLTAMSPDGDEILKKTKAPLRNVRKDLQCVEEDLKSILPLGSDNLIRLPLLREANHAISFACESGFDNSAFVSLIKLIERGTKL